MNIRDMLIGALITLVVTVVSGVAVYYLTREAPPSRPREALVFDIDPPSSFVSDQTKLSFTSIRVKNLGNAPASDVAIGIAFDKTTKIIDKVVKLSSGPAGVFDVQSSSINSVAIVLPVLTPEETVSLTFLTDASDENLPTVGVKSKSTIGVRQTPLHSADTDLSRKEPLGLVLSIIMPLAVLSQLVLLLIFRRTVSRTMLRMFGISVPHSQSINNTAFLYLHSGLIDESLELISREISTDGADPYLLANFGLGLGIKGEAAKADQMLEAAEFWAVGDSRAQSLIALNRAILAFMSNRESDGLDQLRKSIVMDIEIKRYCAYSRLIAAQRQRYPDLHALLNEHGINRKASPALVTT